MEGWWTWWRMPTWPPAWTGCTPISASNRAKTRAPNQGGNQMTTTSRRTLLKAAAALPALGGLPWRSARAQAANTIKVALLCDFSGTYRDVTGPTELACIRQAAAEMSNRGFNIEVLFADNQNKPDVGSNTTRAWIDRDGVDAVIDGGASSVAL